MDFNGDGFIDLDEEFIPRSETKEVSVWDDEDEWDWGTWDDDEWLEVDFDYTDWDDDDDFLIYDDEDDIDTALDPEGW